MWKWVPSKTNSSHGAIQLTTGTYSGSEDKPNFDMCFSKGDDNRRFLRVWECPPDIKDTSQDGSVDERVAHEMNLAIEKVKHSESVQLVDKSTTKSKHPQCVVLSRGATASGALLELANCEEGDISQHWNFDAKTGELRAAANNMCVTAGWPYLSSVAFTTPETRTVLVLMNEAPTDIYVDVLDSELGTMRTAITAHSMETILY